MSRVRAAAAVLTLSACLGFSSTTSAAELLTSTRTCDETLSPVARIEWTRTAGGCETATPTATPTGTPTATPTATPTGTLSPTATPTVPPTTVPPTASPSPTATVAPTAAPTLPLTGPKLINYVGAGAFIMALGALLIVASVTRRRRRTNPTA